MVRACLLLVRLARMSLREVQALSLEEFEEWLEQAVALHRELNGT